MHLGARTARPPKIARAATNIKNADEPSALPGALVPTLPLAVIREAECIGCTKCIQACPIDVIIGAAQQMHTIIAQDCTGCGLCVPVCPVDCIDMIEVPPITSEAREIRAAHAKRRVIAKQKRLVKKKTDITIDALAIRKAEIAAVLARAKKKS